MIKHLHLSTLPPFPVGVCVCLSVCLILVCACVCSPVCLFLACVHVCVREYMHSGMWVCMCVCVCLCAGVS